MRDVSRPGIVPARGELQVICCAIADVQSGSIHDDFVLGISRFVIELRRAPGMKRLVLVGSGHAHVEVLRRSGHTPVPDVDITLISPGRNRVYSATLPGLVAGHYGWRACHIDL